MQNIKLAEAIVGLGTEPVRPPRLPLAGEERKPVEALIRHSIETRPDVARAVMRASEGKKKCRLTTAFLFSGGDFIRRVRRLGGVFVTVQVKQPIAALVDGLQPESF